MRMLLCTAGEPGAEWALSPSHHLGKDIPRVAEFIDVELEIVFIMFGYIIRQICQHASSRHEPSASEAVVANASGRIQHRLSSP